MDDRRDRPAARPHAARAGRRHGRHRPAGRRADPAGRDADQLDFAPEMLQTAQRRAEELGVANVRFKQIDAETSIDLEAASLDGVLAPLGLHADGRSRDALRETRRVLRPGRAGRARRVGRRRRRTRGRAPAPRAGRAGAGGAAATRRPGQFAWAERAGDRRARSRAPGFTEHGSSRWTSRSRTASVETGGRPGRPLDALRRRGRAGRRRRLAAAGDALDAHAGASATRRRDARGPGPHVGRPAARLSAQ